MNEPILKIKHIDNNTFSCVLKISFADSQKYLDQFDLYIKIENNPNNLLHNKIICDKIILPEVYNYFSDNVSVLSLYSNIGTLKFKLHNYFNGDKIIAVCKYNGIEICKTEYIIDDSIKCSYQDLQGENYKIYSNSSKLLNKSRSIISDLYTKLPIISNINWSTSITYFIVDDVEAIFDYVNGYNTLNSFCYTFHNNVICCIFDEQYLKNIITHETVHALLYNAYGLGADPIPRCQRIFVEGFCQYIMNSYVNRKSVYLRYMISSNLLKFHIEDLKNYLEKTYEVSNHHSDIIFSYDFLPYIFSQYGDSSSIIQTIFQLPSNLEEAALKLSELIIKSEPIDEHVQNQAMKRIIALYNKTYDSLYNIFTERCIEDILQFRKKQEFLYFGDY